MRVKIFHEPYGSMAVLSRWCSYHQHEGLSGHIRPKFVQAKDLTSMATIPPMIIASVVLIATLSCLIGLISFSSL